MLELRYIELDENGFITSITTHETETSIGMYLDPMSEIALGFRKYRYDAENNKFIYDESNVIEECLDGLRTEVELSMQKNRNTEFGVKLNSGNFTFRYSEQLKNTLASNQGLVGLGLSDLFKVPCVNEDGKATQVKLSLIDFTKLLKAMVEFANYFEDVLEERLNDIDKLNSIEEIVEFKNRFHIDAFK